MLNGHVEIVLFIYSILSICLLIFFFYFSILCLWPPFLIHQNTKMWRSVMIVFLFSSLTVLFSIGDVAAADNEEILADESAAANKAVSWAFHLPRAL